MRRRSFLRGAALAPFGLAGCSVLGPARRRSQKVLIIGAGLAGLAAGYELTQAGHDVTLLEASERPGGRVQTLRQPFADGLYAEAGALFVPSHHDLTLSYAQLFGLEMEPALPLFEARLIYVRGQRVVANWGTPPEWPFDLTAEERKLGLRGMWRKYISEPAAGTEGPRTDELYDPMSVQDFLHARGASPEAIALLRVGYLDMMGDGAETYSALQLLRGLAHDRSASDRTLFTIRGGSDLLARAFASRLEKRIRYASPITRIEQGDTVATVVAGTNARPERWSADYVICTVPFSVLRHIEVSPPFSPDKKRAIEELPYTSVARVFLQFRRKFWTAENLHVLTITDLPVKWVFEHTINQPGVRGILEGQAFGRDARRIAGMAQSERIDCVLSQLEHIFPGVRQHYERGTSKCWDDERWARGAFAYFRPGQVLSLGPHLARPEGRVYFAGEHTSAWSGWMQGALESGVRAAREVIAAS